jgi:hypothetical protein
MGLLIREYAKRDARGKSRKVQVIATFDTPGIFDVPYDATLHRQFILRELRYRTGRHLLFSEGIRRKLKELASTSVMCQFSGKRQFSAMHRY